MYRILGTFLLVISAILAPHISRALSSILSKAPTAGAMTRGAVICFNHGGGPMPLLGDPVHKSIVESFKKRVPKILRLGTPDAPRAIVLVTAHWSENHPTVSSGASHKLYYDYGGFPPESYSFKYPAPGSPEVAAEVKKAMEAEGLKPALDKTRGWDHGVFVPMMLVNPAADIPIVQVSVLASEDVSQHLAMGRALATLRDRNVAVVGSGFASWHNLPSMLRVMGDPGAAARLKPHVDAWNRALSEAVLQPRGEDRAARLAHWREFPHSYQMHPAHGAEHFLPLLVCAGAAGNESGSSYTDRFVGIELVSYYWE